jgi:hypothetical protein
MFFLGEWLTDPDSKLSAIQEKEEGGGFELGIGTSSQNGLPLEYRWRIRGKTPPKPGIAPSL